MTTVTLTDRELQIIKSLVEGIIMSTDQNTIDELRGKILHLRTSIQASRQEIQEIRASIDSILTQVEESEVLLDKIDTAIANP